MNGKTRFSLLVILVSAFLVGCFAIGDFVWEDLDGDGIQDAGEIGLAGAVVNIYEGNTIGPTPADSVATTGSGAYQFTNLSPGEYTLEFVPPLGYSFSPQDATTDNLDSDPDSSSGLLTIEITENVGTDLDVDSGMVAEAEEVETGSEESEVFSIGDFVWMDSNGDGIQDEGEPGVEGVGVSLRNSSDSEVAATSTDADGLYAFNGVPAGEMYYVVFAAPEGISFTLQDQGSDDALDSDADPDTGETAAFTLSGDTFDVDAGLVEETAGGGESVEAMCYGPDEFPEGYSALTGQMVDDPSLLDLRPVFLSISLFPPHVRPPTGLSVTPITYQFYIGQGDTRLLAAFYGEYPEIVFNPEQTGAQNEAPSGELVVGNWVWFDLNGNSVQDDGEPGVPRIPVKLYVDGKTFATTETDDNGFYYFNYDAAETPSTVQLEFDIPQEFDAYYFVAKGAGDDRSKDSDVFVEGFTELFTLPAEIEEAASLDIDVGLRRSTDRIEGVRSGRVFYEDIRTHFCGCVITAGADPAVAAQIQTCGFAASNDVSDEGASGVDIVQLGNIAQQSSSDSACSNPNLTGNLFCTEPPEGAAGNELLTFWNVTNSDRFVYDPGSGAYNWYKNVPSDPETFELMTDGLNGETLTFENVIIMLTQHTQVNADATIFEMNLGHTTGTAYIFRNGQMYEAMWSSIATPYEQSTGLQQPFRFTDMDGNPFPLAPGQTFVQLLHTFHVFEEVEPGVWRARFYAPAYNP